MPRFDMARENFLLGQKFTCVFNQSAVGCYKITCMTDLSGCFFLTKSKIVIEREEISKEYNEETDGVPEQRLFWTI